MSILWIGASDSNYTKGRTAQIKKIVLHWMVGDLESCDATFNDGRRNASAHYGIGGELIHQYVKEYDTAWHAGDWYTNCESIGIEHEGGWLLDDGTRFKPTEETHKTSASLVSEICKRYDIPLDRDHIIGHNEVSATQCPGSLDIDHIISLAKNVDSCEKELDEMRESRNKWRTECKKVQEDFEEYKKEKTDHIESIQKTVSEQTLTISSLNKRIQTLEDENKTLREALVTSDCNNKELNDTISDLMERLEDFENETPLSSYSRWELFKAVFRKR